ncbi:PBP1A family penicillin-binding protein [Candidatus Kaiserbacteria bacterium]|nr:PBP1A family penicillin-binding protein [Candidatus Kaiserbacteria bacterium]
MLPRIFRTPPHAPRKLHPEVRRSLKIVGFSLAGALGIFVAWALLVSLPSVDSFENRKVAESTKIYDRTGNVLLYDVHGSMRRTDVPLEDISPFVRNATVAIEDATFYQHHGFRPLSFLRAVLVNLRLIPGIRGQGGSTITQQVVKNTLLTKDKTLIRKAKEIVLALKLERIATKDEILNIYLNETSYGGTIYGVEEAANYFFGVPAKDVTLAEAAYLAALPQAPTRYSPYGNHRDELEDRKNLVLSRMKDSGFINDEEYKAALAETVEFSEQAESGIKAAHFVFYIREYLEEKYGADVVSNGGLRIITTLDYDLQKKAEEIVEARALANAKNFNAENAGLVAIDPKTGQILAMVGSRGYFDEEIDGKVNIAVAKRQPGSSFKPFVYAAAFEKGYTPETILFDLKTQFTGYCAPNDFETHDNCYSPGNYDNTYRGPMSLREALAQSINVVAVKLLYLVGIDDSLNMAQRMGLTTLGDKSRYGLTLVLGGGEVTLLEMTGAYAGYANDGVLNPPTGILEVEDGDETLEKYEDNGTRAVEPQIARTLSDVLSDNVARSPAFGSDSALYIPGYDVAAKTGTTNDYRDAWILGYTTGIAAGAWAGNNDNSPMEKRVAGFIVAPMWREFMEYALTKYPAESFIPPAPESNLDSLPPVLRGVWNTNPTVGVHEILYWVQKGNPRAGAPSNAQADPQFPLWEYPVALWANQATGSSTPISGGDDFAIVFPSSGQSYANGSKLKAAVEYLSSLGITKVTYYANGVAVGSSTVSPFEIEFTPSQSGTMTLRAVAESVLGARENSVTFTVQ